MRRRSAFVAFCAAALVSLPASAPADVTLQARKDFAPFSDQKWADEGMVSEILSAAMAQSPDPVDMKLVWPKESNTYDRVVTHSIDMAYPWPKPNCSSIDRAEVCDTLHFSDPVVELIWLLFTQVDAQFAFNQAQDLDGKTLCVANEGSGGALAKAGLEWTQNVPADTRIAPDLAACFDLLMDGRVDAVAVNEFQGVAQLFQQNLTEKVVPLPKPVATQPLHLVVSRTHWRATTLLYRFNAGLAKLRQTGAYGDIVARHVSKFWAGINR